MTPDSHTERPGTDTARSAFVAALGVGALFLTIESERLLAIGANGNFSLDRFPSYFAGFSCVVLLVVAYCLAPQLFRARMLVEASIAVLYSASKLVVLGQSIIPADSTTLFFFSSILDSVGGALLCIIWFRELGSYGARFAAQSFAYGIIFLATLNLLTLLMKDEAVHGVIVSLPIVSIGCLFYLRKMAPRKPSARSTQGATTDATSRQVPYQSDQSLLSAEVKPNKNRIVIAGGFYTTLACLALIFGQIHYKWLPLQDGSSISLVIQLGTALGSIGGSLCILALLKYFWNRRGIELCELLLFGITVVALWLSEFAEMSWILLFVALLNTMQKLAFLLILLSPFIIVARRDWLRPLLISYLAFDIGKLASVSTFALSGEQPDITYAIVALALLLVSSVTIAFIGRPVNELGGNPVDNDAPPGHISPQVQTLGSPEQKTDSPASASSDKDGTRGHKLQHSCATLAEKYALTERESETLFLLARGRTSQHIASSMFIAQTTVKTHQRSIYAKLGVHSQQELLTLIEKTIDQQRAGSSALPR
jgi:DNA-binding CsgD family transcriptional regulator